MSSLQHPHLTLNLLSFIFVLVYHFIICIKNPKTHIKFKQRNSHTMINIKPKTIKIEINNKNPTTCYPYISRYKDHFQESDQNGYEPYASPDRSDQQA